MEQINQLYRSYLMFISLLHLWETPMGFMTIVVLIPPVSLGVIHRKLLNGVTPCKTNIAGRRWLFRPDS